jgi:hypothetical protein
MNSLRTRLSNERGNWSLIGLLVAVAIGFAIYSFFISPKMSGRDQQTRQQASEMGVKLDENKTLSGAVADKSRETQCKSQLDQIRQGIVMFRDDHNNSNPAALTDIRLSVGPNFFKCPVGQEAYSYDPATGSVKCIHPGHEGL